MKRQSLLSSLCLCLCVLCACQSTPAQNDSSDTNDTAQNTAQTDAVTEEVRVYPTYEIDMNGDSFTMLYFDAVAVCGWSSEIPCDIDVPEQTGDLLADAVYARNRKIEEMYNCKITAVPTDWTFAEVLNRSVMAGDGAYDLVFPHWQIMNTLISQHSILQLDGLIDVSMPWWDEKSLEGFRVAGKTFALSGDVTFMDKFSDIIIMFNQQMVQNYDLGDIYQLVIDHKWTYDTMLDMVKQVSADLDMNGKYDKNDRYGFSGQNDGLYELFNSSGEKFCDLDDDGIPYLSCTSERAVSVLTRVYEFMNDTANYFNRQTQNLTVADTVAMFKSDQVLFIMRPLQTLFELRSMDADFGIIPTPLMDDTQKDYYTSIGYTVAIASCIPTDAKNAETSAAVLDTLAAESYYSINDVLYEKILGAKVSRDDQSTKNLDIIFDSHIYDPGEIFSFGNLASDMMSNWKGMDTKVASTIEKRTAKVEKSIADFLEVLEEEY
ncbi:MAG: hypothetical protein ACI3XM_07475 [Eubacteriales bacterium]